MYDNCGNYSNYSRMTALKIKEENNLWRNNYVALLSPHLVARKRKPWEKYKRNPAISRLCFKIHQHALPIDRDSLVPSVLDVFAATRSIFM